MKFKYDNAIKLLYQELMLLPGSEINYLYQYNFRSRRRWTSAVEETPGYWSSGGICLLHLQLRT